jgi:hypothetical protein
MNSRDLIATIAGALVVILQIINAVESAQVLTLEKQIGQGIERNYSEGNQKFAELSRILESVAKSRAIGSEHPPNAPSQ